MKINIEIKKPIKNEISISDALAYGEVVRNGFYQTGNVDTENSDINIALKLLIEKKISPKEYVKIIDDIKNNRQEH